MKAFKSGFVLVVCFLALSVFLDAPLFASEVPALKGRVNDYAGILSDGAVRQLEMVLADVSQTAFSPEVSARFIGGGDLERSRITIEKSCGETCGDTVPNGDVISSPEGYRVGPCPGLVGREMGAPDIARGSGGLGSIAISRVVAGHEKGFPGGWMAEGDIDPVVAEGVSAGSLVGIGAVP